MAQASHPCPRCQGPLSWVAQYSKWYCYKCALYPFEPAAPAAASSIGPVSVAPAPTSDHAPSSDPAIAGSTASRSPPCPTCKGALAYVAQYKAWFCHVCQKYAAVADPRHAMAKCPTCGAQLTYSSDRAEWYCYTCRKYVRQQGAVVNSPSAVAEDAPSQEEAPTPDSKLADEPASPSSSSAVDQAKEAGPPATGEAPSTAVEAEGTASSWSGAKPASETPAPRPPAAPEDFILGELKRSKLARRPEPAPVAPEVMRGTIIEDVFLLYNDGRLIRHYTRRLKPTVDSEILSSMLVAVSAFVKDARISEEEGEAAGLDEIKYGALRIHLARGKYLTVAMLIQGDDAEGVVTKARKQIHAIETMHTPVLKDWDGRVSAMQPVHKHIESLFG